MRALAVAAPAMLMVVGLSCGDEVTYLGEPCTQDADCDDGRLCNGVETCDPASSRANFLGCVSERNPEPCVTGEQTCSDAMNRCVAICDVNPDVDSDGFTDPECGGTDCNDSDVDAFPGNSEICDPLGHDEDCDPTTFGDRDLDGDGDVDSRCVNVAPDGTTLGGDDCNDYDPLVSPDSAERCNGEDDDCDGTVDEDVEAVYLYADTDGDGFGDAAMEFACRYELGYVDNKLDCDDTNAALFPGSMRCDGVNVEICTGGVWVKANCPAEHTCIPQPNGTGICQNTGP